LQAVQRFTRDEDRVAPPLRLAGEGFAITRSLEQAACQSIFYCYTREIACGRRVLRVAY